MSKEHKITMLVKEKGGVLISKTITFKNSRELIKQCVENEKQLISNNLEDGQEFICFSDYY